MSRSKYLKEAIASAFGIAIELPSVREAIAFRRSLYRARDKARCRGDAQYEGLSFLVRGKEVRIVRQDRVLQVHQPNYKVRELHSFEIPPMLAIRGFQKPSLTSILLHSAVDDYAKRLAADLIRPSRSRSSNSPNVASGDKM